MLQRLTHRGPDGHGAVRVGNAWLGHRRLAIVDLEGGVQPLADDARSRWLVANGEIYNHEELRAELEPRHHFRSRSDNEVILHVWEQEGPPGLERLAGMYAVAMATPDAGLVAARDPLGIKPLYWAQREGQVAFASELKAFDRDWLPDVREFPPGFCWTPAEGLRRFQTVPIPPEPAAEPMEEHDLERTEARLRHVFTRAVERRLMADVPVGVLLSGGLDSSLTASVAVRVAARRGLPRLKSFAVGTPNSPDLLAAREVADYQGTDHHECVYDPHTAGEILPEVIRATELFDPSTIRSALANYLVAELASRHVKVVLTGEGADELFAGYRYVRHLDPSAVHGELARTVLGLHNMNLQRCDRTSMAYGLEARVPFLDLDMIATSLAISPRYKLWFDGRRRVEKWILRHAFDGYLPESILWRNKMQFGDGSGSKDALKTVSRPGAGTRREPPGAPLDPPPRTEEERYYYDLFCQDYGGVKSEHTVGRFLSMV